MAEPTWTPPSSLEEAEQRKAALIGEIETINAQLGNRDSSRRSDYWSWRQKVKWAGTQKLRELRQIKLWISQNKAGPYTLADATEESVIAAAVVGIFNEWFDDIQTVQSVEPEDVADFAGNVAQAIRALYGPVGSRP
jgi:hypothetical protein